jgi:hypothetical protein
LPLFRSWRDIYFLKLTKVFVNTVKEKEKKGENGDYQSRRIALQNFLRRIFALVLDYFMPLLVKGLGVKKIKVLWWFKNWIPFIEKFYL